MDDERSIEAHGPQVGITGNHTHVEGGIHFHGPSARQSLHQIPEPTATFKGREKELNELTEAVLAGTEAGPAACRRLS